MRCDRCTYWDHREPPHPVAADVLTLGRCRRHTPRLPRSGMRGEWPTTEATDWCGEFVERGNDAP